VDVTAEQFNWSPVATLERWDDTADFEAGREPDSVDVYEGNLLLNAGITRLGSLLVGGGGTAFNAANSRIGVGNSTTAASAAQTDLQGASKFFKLCSSASWSAQTGTWVATFGSSDANFAWEEWGIDNGTADSSTVTAPLLNRKVVAMGTKGSGSTWQLTVTITVS
jgi:hypothetical protein